MPMPTDTNSMEIKQRLVAATGDILITVFALFLVIVSFSVKDPTPYLFPRILAVVMLLFCVFQLVAVARGRAPLRLPETIFADLKSALPAVAVIVAYVVVAEMLGFYLSAALAYFAVVLTGEARESRYQRRTLLRAALTALCVTVALYGLFSLLLQVQSPRGILM